MKSFKFIAATAICALSSTQAEAAVGVYTISSNGVFSLSTDQNNVQSAVQAAMSGCMANGGFNCYAPQNNNGYLYISSGGFMSVARSESSNRGVQIMSVGYSWQGQGARDIAWNSCKAQARGLFYWVSDGRGTRTEPLANTCRVIYHKKV